MALKGIGCLPVVDEQGRLQGLLSETDVLRAFAAGARAGEPGKAPSVASADERLVEAIRTERERVAQTVARHDQVHPGLAEIRLKALEEAAARAEAGQLRACVRCKGTISANRLRALPGTRICSRCSREAD
jgi:CBS domain-containing protein